MKRITNTFTTRNNLEEKILLVKIKRKNIDEINYSLDYIEREIADYCGVSVITLRKVKANHNQPSIALGMSLAKYFDCKVEDIFELIEL